MISELALFFGGAFIGMLGVVFGATMFVAIPMWQNMFPWLSYAQIFANIKVGSLTRGIAATFSTWEKIAFKEVISIIIPFTLGSILGTFITTKLSQDALLPAVIMAIIISELSPRLAHLINKKTRFIFAILMGIYGGLIGPGISILIVALLRTYFPRDNQLVFVKLQAPFIELTGTIFGIFTNIYFGNILWNIVLYWGLGMFIGGYIGGHVLKKTLRVSQKVQRIYFYIIYAVALVPLIISRFFAQ